MKKRIIIISICSFLLLVLILIGLYFYGLTPVSKTSEIVKFEARGGAINIANDLYNAGLVKSKIATNIYVRINKKLAPKAGTYELDRSLSTKEIFDILNVAPLRDDIIKVTFIEGKRITDYVSIISEKFGYKEEEIYEVINNKEYLKTLIDKYDFLTDSVLNSDIYYPLEGYLYPATYEFYKDSSIKAIIEKMLDKTEKVLDNIKAYDADKSIHEILTIASIVEAESKFKEDRALVSQVIYKRLELKMSLGMDVTTYYGVRKSMKEDLTKNDLNSNNAYNTRNTSFIGLPVGPICNPRLESIEAAINPSNTNYVYFYADVYGKDGKDSIGKLHFAETYEEFKALIKKYS